MKHPRTIGLLVVGLAVGAASAIALTGVHAQSVDSPAATDTETTTIATVTTAATTTTPTAPRENHRQQKLDTMAKLLGITSAQLQTELQSGKPFYQIAAEHGVTYDKMKANADTQHKARLDDMVKVGYLTQAEADTALKNFQANSANMPMMGMGFGHHGFGF